MSINLPPELDWVAKLAVGQDWPKGDEDKLRSLGEAWEDAARQLTAISREIDPATVGVLHSIGGDVANEFSNFTQQLKSNLPDMAEAAGQLGELGKNTGLQVEYAKYMLLAQLVWLAVEIAELAFWAPEVIPVLVTGVRAIVKMVLKRLLIAIATGVAFMVGMDVVIQGIQFLKTDRTKWDTAATLQALEGGAIGGAVGGVISGLGSAVAPKFAASLIGKGVVGGVSSIATTEVMEQIFGGENDMGAALASGIVGALGGGGGRRRYGGEHNEIHTPDTHLPKVPFEGGLGIHGPKDFDIGGLGKGEGLGKHAIETNGLGKGLHKDDTAGAHNPTSGTRSTSSGETVRGSGNTAPHIPATESEGPVTGGSRETSSTPHTSLGNMESAGHSGGLPGFETTPDGHGSVGHTVTAPGEGAPATVRDGRHDTMTPVQHANTPTQHPAMAEHHPGTTAQGTGPAEPVRTSSPAASGNPSPTGTDQSRVPHTTVPNRSQEPGSGLNEPLAPSNATHHTQTPDTVTGRPQVTSTVANQPQAPVTEPSRPPTESGSAPRPALSVESPSATHPGTEATPHQEPTATAQPRPPTVTSDGTPRSPATDNGTRAGQDEAAPRAPRPATESGTSTREHQRSTSPAGQPTGDGHTPALPDVPHHEPGTTPHPQDHQDGTLGDRSSGNTDERLRRLGTLVVPTHDPDPPPPLHQAPSPPGTRPVSPDAGIRQRTADLDRAARAAGMSEGDREAYSRAIREAAASGNWEHAGQHLTDFRAHVETSTTNQRYDAFHAHAHGGFDRLTNLTGSKEEWQSKVDAVGEARRSGDPDLLDSRLNEYSAYVENHVPSESLTGHDTPRPFHQDVEDVRRRLAMTRDGPAADRLRSQLDDLRQDAELRDRLAQLRSSSESDPETAALHERLDNARTPDEADRALRDLEDHREVRELQQRLDHLKSDEPMPERAPLRGSDEDLRRRLEALNEGADEHERELREQVDRAASADEADRALRDLHEYREEQQLQQRLDRLRSDISEDHPSEQELRDRLDALHDGEGDPRAAELRRQAHEAATEREAKDALDQLDQHLDRREQDRREQVQDLTDRLEQLRQQRTEQLLAGHSRDAEDTGRRIEEVREELSSHRTYDERTSTLRQELAQKAGSLEAPGHLDRITTGTGRRGGTDEHAPAGEHTQATTYTPASEHTTLAHGGTSAEGNAVKAHADHSPARDQHTPGEQGAKPDTGPRQPHQERPHHQDQENGPLVAHRPPEEHTNGRSDGDTTDPRHHPVPGTEGLDELRPSGPPPRMELDRTPRYVVRSGFDQRRFTVGDTPYTDLTMRVALHDDGSGRHDAGDTWNRAQQGVKQYFNDPQYTLPNGDRLHVTIERVGPGDRPHLTVDLLGTDHGMNQRSWTRGAKPVEYAHEISHQLGLRDEYADETAPQRPHIPGSLLGDVHQHPEHRELAHGGLRDRHLQLLGALTAGHDDLLSHQGHTGDHRMSHPQNHTGESVAPRGPKQGTLHDYLPENEWWKFYIDPKNHAEAQAAFPHDPGLYYDHDRSPGFQKGMVAAYTKFLGNPETVKAPMDSSAYRTMHSLATSHLNRDLDWSGSGTTHFPLQGEALAPDIFGEKVGDRVLVYDTTTHDWSKGLPKPQPATILTRFLHNSPALSTNYQKGEASGLVDTVFRQHYERLDEPGADDRAKLGSIARTIRSLHVIHPFEDGNLHSNVQILLPKLLLEQGYRPIVPDDIYSLFQGGRSADEMVDSLVRNGALDTGMPHLSGDQWPSDQVAPKLPGPSTDDATTYDGTQPPPPVQSDHQGHGQHQGHANPADDPAWQHARDQAPAVPRQHAWVDPVSNPTRQLEPVTTPHEEQATSHPTEAGKVDAHTARRTYGMPEKNFKGFRQIARDKNLVIDVRPTNPTAPKWLDAGAMAKPQDIKAKTINATDVHLGANPKNIGLVGYFKPKMPEQSTVPPGDWDKVVSRYNQRSTEYRELAAKMTAYEADNKFAVKDGVVYGIAEDGAQRPITGDHDLFDISTPGGTRIPHPAHDGLIKEMQAKDIAVMHGAHMFWNPPSSFSKSVFDKIVGSHHGPDGEPLLRFHPGNDHAELTWAEPLKTGEVDSYTARHAYGIPEKNFREFRQIARDKNLVIDVRPTNPTAPKWLDAGAMAKPQDIKAKTINATDVHLGANPKNIGLVGYFKPKMPEQSTVPPGDWDKVVSRYNQRSTEYRELAAKMALLDKKNKFTVVDGVVHGIGEGGTQRPITGDHDLFDISTPHGTRIPLEEHDALIKEMQAKDIAVMHGAHMFWSPPSSFSKSVFDKIVGSHHGPDGEPLLRFHPGNDHAELTWPQHAEESHKGETPSDGSADKNARDRRDQQDHQDREGGAQGHQDRQDHKSSGRHQGAKDGNAQHKPAEHTITKQEPGKKPQQQAEDVPKNTQKDAPKAEPEKDDDPAQEHTPPKDEAPAQDDITRGDEQQEKPPAPPQKGPSPVLDGRHTESLAGKKITEDPGPDGVRTRIETLLGDHGRDISVTQRLDAALDPADFRKQHGQMVNGGLRFPVHVDGRPYEVEVKASASPWRLDPTTDVAKDNDGDGFGVPSESTRDSDPRNTEMTSSETGLEFGPTIVHPAHKGLSVLVTPSGKLGGATHGRETTVKSSSQTANQVAFTGKTDSYTSEFTYQVKVTDHQGNQLGAEGTHDTIAGKVRADVPRPEDLADGRPRTWQGWDPARTDQPDTAAAPVSRTPKSASGHPVSITGLDTAREAVYEALPREARPDGTAHRDIEEFFQPSNVINEFEHASGWGLLSKPLTLSDGSKAHLHLTMEPDGSQALHTVDNKATLGWKSSNEHGQGRTENNSWSLGLSGGATGEVWKAKDSSETTWLTGTAGYTSSSSLTHGAKGKNAIGTESGHEHSGKADLVATKVRLRVQLIRHQFQPGLDGLHGTSTTKIGDHSPAPSEQRPQGAADHVTITINPQNGEVLRAVPHDGPAQEATGDHPPLDAGRLTGPVAAQRTAFLDFPGSSELEDHIVREMWNSSPGVLPPPEAIHPGTAAAHDGSSTAQQPRITPEAWENLRSLRGQLTPSQLRGAGPILLDGTYRITLKSPHLPLRDGTVHEILIKAAPAKGDHVGSGKSTTKAVTTRTTGTDKTVTRSTKHVVSLAGNVRSSLDHPNVTHGFGIGSLDITAHNPSHGLTMGAETEVKRQFSLKADTDTYAHPVTYHVMIGVADPKQPTTHLSTDAPSPQMQHIQQVRPDGHLIVKVARTPQSTGTSTPPPAIPEMDVLPQRHAIRHVTDSEDFRDKAQQSLYSAFQKKSLTPIPELKEALDGITDEDHLRSMVSASHGGWANSGDEQVGSGRNRDTIGLSTRTHLSNFRFHETLPGEGKLEIETKSSVSTAVADKTTRAFKVALGFDARRFPSKHSPDASLQVRGGLKGKGGASHNSGENVKQKMTTSRKAVYKGTWHVYEADADVIVQGRVTDAKGNVVLGDPQTSRHRVVVLLSDDDIRKLGTDATANTTTPAPAGTRQAPLLTSRLLGGATAAIPKSDEILREIDRQIRKLDTPADVPETALPFAGTFSPENLSASYEDLVGRGILDYHVHESRTQRVITEVLVRGIPQDKWTDRGDHSTGDTTRKVGIAQTVKGSAGHNWSLGADGNLQLSYAPMVKPRPGQDPAAVKAEEHKSGLGSIAWAPSGGGEGSRSKSAETGVTTKVVHKTSKFGDTVKFTNRMRFEVTVTQRTEYGRFVNLAKPRPVDPPWPVHAYVPRSLTETADQAAAHQQTTHQPSQPPQVHDGGDTIGMQPITASMADRDRWQASLDSAHDLVGFDSPDALLDHAQTVLTTPRPWGDGVLGRTGSAISWGLGTAASTVGRWAGAMTPEAAHKLVSSFISDPRLDGTANPLIREQRLPLEQQVPLRQALSPATLPTVFHQLKDSANGYRTVPFGADGKTGLEVHMQPTGEAQEISTRDNGSDEITVSTEHESSTTAGTGLNASLTPLNVPVITKNPAVVVPLPTGALKMDRDQSFQSSSPVTRKPGVPNRTLAPPAIPHSKEAGEPGKATLKGPQVLLRQPVRLTTQKYDENGTYGNTAHTDGHVYYWATKKTEETGTPSTVTDQAPKAPAPAKHADDTTQQPKSPEDVKQPAKAHESVEPAEETSGASKPSAKKDADSIPQVKAPAAPSPVAAHNAHTHQATRNHTTTNHAPIGQGTTAHATSGARHKPLAPPDHTVTQPPGPYHSERLTIGEIAFWEESVELQGGQRETVHRLAAEVAWASLANMRASLPPPQVVVVGHANGLRDGLPHFGEALLRGQVRADGIAEEFRSALATHLSNLQSGAETVMSAGDITVVSRSEGLAIPEGAVPSADLAGARRLARIEIDLPRSLLTQTSETTSHSSRPVSGTSPKTDDPSTTIHRAAAQHPDEHGPTFRQAVVEAVALRFPDIFEAVTSRAVDLLQADNPVRTFVGEADRARYLSDVESIARKGMQHVPVAPKAREISEVGEAALRAMQEEALRLAQASEDTPAGATPPPQRTTVDDPHIDTAEGNTFTPADRDALARMQKWQDSGAEPEDFARAMEHGKSVTAEILKDLPLLVGDPQYRPSFADMPFAWKVVTVAADHFRHGASGEAYTKAREAVMRLAPGNSERPAAGRGGVNYKLIKKSDKRGIVESSPALVWRFETRPPEELFGVGLHARNTARRVTLREWIAGDTDSQFLSTTTDRSLWYNNRRWRWEIHPRHNSDPWGIDVTQTDGSAIEDEIAFTDRIDPQALASVYDRQLNQTAFYDPATRVISWVAGDRQSRSQPPVGPSTPAPTAYHVTQPPAASSSAPYMFAHPSNVSYTGPYYSPPPAGAYSNAYPASPQASMSGPAPYYVPPQSGMPHPSHYPAPYPQPQGIPSPFLSASAPEPPALQFYPSLAPSAAPVVPGFQPGEPMKKKKKWYQKFS
ncbi:WXG100-like domain-containing protein [Streptomyces mirabilis]|uniref:WXG100-like domain-containing protein n=1 Tax=Streptomyces mirabilis TaxID=68239 RepID=UPI0036BD9E77